MDDSLVDYLDKGPEILDFEYFVEQERKQRVLDELREEYDFEDLFRKINDGKVPEQIEFYFGGDNENFFTRCAWLGLDNKNENFIEFFSSDYSSRILRESKISIHIETGNLYYENLNTGESLYHFLLNQQDQKKKLIDASFSHGGSFSEYLTEFLQGKDAEADDRFDMLTNKNVKYLFYRYNDCLLSKGLLTVSLRHSRMSQHKIALEEIQNKN